MIIDNGYLNSGGNGNNVMDGLYGKTYRVRLIFDLIAGSCNLWVNGVDHGFIANYNELLKSGIDFYPTVALFCEDEVCRILDPAEA